MKEIKKYSLTFLPTFIYVKETLQGSNSVSSAILEYVKFESGKFYTYLPLGIEDLELYKFSKGKAAINNYRETASVILQKFKENKNMFCLIDDVIRDPTDINIPTFAVPPLFFKKEVYYLINYRLASLENILKCLRETDAIWHSLCVLTQANLNLILDPKLTETNIREIAQEAQLVIVGAYDGDGYVFWERYTQTS